jgi:hypothetical protein
MVLLLTISTVFAQYDDRRDSIEMGVKAGVNVSNVWDSEGEEFTADSKAGYAVGVFVGIPIGHFLGFQPEVLISQKGFKGSGTLLGFPYATTRTTTYLDIPLQVQLKPIEILTIVAGPQFSYLLKQKDSYTFGGVTTDQEEEFNNENARDNILGFVVGADLFISHLVLSGRLGWDFQDNHGDGTSSTPRYKNRWMQFTVGYKF